MVDAYNYGINISVNYYWDSHFDIIIFNNFFIDRAIDKYECNIYKLIVIVKIEN
jgi:hypothetical protein